jgi:methyltransferase
MALLGRRVGVSIPDTVLEDKESLREKTAKLGLIARACAIYGVDVIEVFRDPRGRGEGKIIREVLEYLETPQYLRKRLYPIDETLKFAGVLPPLRIPSHKPRVPVERIGPGEVREGVVNDDGSVDVGLDVSPRLGGDAQPGTRVTVRISSMKPPRADVIAKDSLREYWGYMVETNQLDDVLADSRFRAKIATSRFGMPLPKALGRLRTLMEGGNSVKLMFGSPSRGLFDMVGRDLDHRVDLVLNLFPAQQVETVRTEEAIFAGLGVVSLISAEKA